LEIAELSHIDPVHATELLWKEAWKGNVTSDTFRVLRKGVLSRFAAQPFGADERLTSRRSGFNRWKSSSPWKVIGSGSTLPRTNRIFSKPGTE